MKQAGRKRPNVPIILRPVKKDSPPSGPPLPSPSGRGIGWGRGRGVMKTPTHGNGWGCLATRPVPARQAHPWQWVGPFGRTARLCENISISPREFPLAPSPAPPQHRRPTGHSRLGHFARRAADRLRLCHLHQHQSREPADPLQRGPGPAGGKPAHRHPARAAQASWSAKGSAWCTPCSIRTTMPIICSAWTTCGFFLSTWGQTCRSFAGLWSRIASARRSTMRSIRSRGSTRPAACRGWPFGKSASSRSRCSAPRRCPSLAHGRCEVLGYRFGDVAYCTDTKGIEPASMALLEGLDVLVLDALRVSAASQQHFSLEEADAAGRRAPTHPRVPAGPCSQARSPWCRCNRPRCRSGSPAPRSGRAARGWAPRWHPAPRTARSRFAERPAAARRRPGTCRVTGSNA